MDWSQIIPSLVIALITEQLLQWAPQVAKCLIYSSTRLLPEGLKDRMFEEWCAHLNEIKGKCRKLIFAIQTYPAALCMRQEAFGQLPIHKLIGDWQYTVVGPEGDSFWAGNCQIGFDLRGAHFQGVLTQIVEHQQSEEKVEAPWRSTRVCFKWLESNQQMGLSVHYILMLEGRQIPGEFTVSYTGQRFRNRLSGTLTRMPIVNGQFQLRKTN